MFSELPGFFDRNFIIAFFFPSLLFVLAGYGLMISFNIEPKLTGIISDELYKDATVVGVTSLIISIFLLSFNFNIFKFFEGYGKYNPLKLLLPIHEQKFFRIKEKKQQLHEARKEAELSRDDEALAEVEERRIELYQYAADYYPLKNSRILPTAFGNAVRAFEEYSEVMYGADAIVSWVRLLPLIPKDFREMINTARAQLDMWLNFRLLSYVLIVAYLIMAFSAGQIKLIWLPLAAFGFGMFASGRATGAAVLYGDFVKASYDLYLPDLRDQIRLPETATIEDEKNLWRKFTRQVTYHSEKSVLQRVPGKSASKKDSPASEE